MRGALLAAVMFVVPAATVVLDNPRVRVYRTTDNSMTGVEHGPGVVISLDNRPGSTDGNAVWMDNVLAQGSTLAGGSLVVVQPRRPKALPVPTPAPAPSQRPGGSGFTGMSFKQLFANDMVTVIRARMEVGATEAFHTHGADTLVVHLSGGEIEDTADGKTKVNRWKRGDVEFEARGSSHSARNVGKAVDVFLVALKP